MQRELPQCRHRGEEVRRGQWTCRSPKLVLVHGLVRAEDCLACLYADHPSDPLPPEWGARETGGDRPAPAGPPKEVILRPEMLAIAMITAPRSLRTVDASLEELRHGGFSQKIDVFAEPGADLPPLPGVTVHRNAATLGAWRNWRQAARWLLENSPAPYLLVCEDDIRLSADAALGLQHAIDTLPADDWGFASLYTPKWNLRQHVPHSGWQAVDLREGSWGALAFCFTREALNELLAATEPQSAQATADVDILAGMVFGALGRKCYLHLPSLCAHAGDGLSTLGHEHGHNSRAVGFKSGGGHYVSVRRNAPDPDCKTWSVPDAMRPATDFGDASVCVTALFRFDRLKVLLSSIRRYYPAIEIVVADNSFRPEDWSEEQFRVFRDILIRHHARPVLLPFDSGISATRNAAVTAARTPYVIVCEEDFEFTPHTNLEKLLRPIRAGQADLIGGLERYTNGANGWIQACVPAGLPRTVQYTAHLDFAGPWPRRRLTFRPVDNQDMSELSGVICRRADVIHNFYAARRATYLHAPCDEQIKVCEHLDHFLRLKERGARVYYTPESVVDHYTPGDADDPRFWRLRARGAAYHQRFCENWGLDPAGSSDFGLDIGLTPVAFVER
jgi:glycosyltransferase involved in cell wall biosynthesis